MAAYLLGLQWQVLWLHVGNRYTYNVVLNQVSAHVLARPVRLVVGGVVVAGLVVGMVVF